MEDIQFGQFGLSVVLSVIVGIIFKMLGGDNISERIKISVMVGVGLVLGLVAVPYGGLPWTIVNIVNCLLVGLMSAAAASGFYSWTSKGVSKANGGATNVLAYLLIPLLFLSPVALNGCGVGATGSGASVGQSVTWYEGIQNWTPHQRANFFMDTWRAENATYKAQNAIPNKSEDAVKLLNIKRQVLENSRIPIRMYASIVKAGGSPDQDIEQEIIAWIRQLQMQALSK